MEQWGKVLHYNYNDTDGTKSQMEGVILAVKQEPDKIVEVIKNYFVTRQFSVIDKRGHGIDLKKITSIYQHAITTMKKLIFIHLK